MGCECGAMILDLLPWSSMLPLKVQASLWVASVEHWYCICHLDHQHSLQKFRFAWTAVESRINWGTTLKGTLRLLTVSDSQAQQHHGSLCNVLDIGSSMQALLLESHFQHTCTMLDHTEIEITMSEEPYLHRCPFMKLPWWLIVPHSTKVYS